MAERCCWLPNDFNDGGLQGEPVAAGAALWSAGVAALFLVMRSAPGRLTNL
jgi:hypothetical protein